MTPAELKNHPPTRHHLARLECATFCWTTKRWDGISANTRWSRTECCGTLSSPTHLRGPSGNPDDSSCLHVLSVTSSGAVIASAAGESVGLHRVCCATPRGVKDG